MSMIADLFVKLGFKSDEFNKGIDGAKQKTSAFGSAMGKIGGILAGAFAVTKIFEFGKTALSEYNKAEQGAMRLYVALGRNSEAQEMLINQAKKLQSITLFEDDETVAAQAAMAMLIKEADKIRELTPLVQDLATAKGIDLASAGFMVAKAVEGSGAALQKMGIQVEGTAGSAERFKSVMDGLSKAVGGQAQAAATIGTGGLKQLANAFGNLTEAIGGGMAESTAFKSSLKDVTGYIEDVTAIMESKYKGKWQKFWEIFSGKTLGAAKIEQDKKETEAKWKKELGPKEAPAAKPKEYTVAEQLTERIKSLKQEISDTVIEMKILSGSSPEYKAKADELKGFKDELAELTGSTKKQEEADKLAADAKAALVDRLILQRIEEQKIAALQGKKITTTDKGILLEELSAKGGGKLAVPETKLAGLQVGADTIAAAAAEQKNQELIARQEANTKIEDEEKRFNESLNSLLQSGMADAASSFGEGLGALMSGDMNIGEFGLTLLATVGKFMVQFGQLLIAYAIAASGLQAAIKTPGAWPIALAAGIALVAIGSAISSMSSKGMSGASSSAGGGGGSSAASGYSGKQNQSNAAESFGANVTFEIQGNKLIGVMNNQDRRNQNFK